MFLDSRSEDGCHLSVRPTPGQSESPCTVGLQIIGNVTCKVPVIYGLMKLFSVDKDTVLLTYKESSDMTLLLLSITFYH